MRRTCYSTCAFTHGAGGRRYANSRHFLTMGVFA